jgi:16S rRNA (cytosine1402-N4)-methyltransferase
MASVHVPVLLHEVVEALVGARTFTGSTLIDSAVIGKGSRAQLWYLDGTLGGAGHALAIAKAFEVATRTSLNVIGLDRDPVAIERARGSFGNQRSAGPQDEDAGQESPGAQEMQDAQRKRPVGKVIFEIEDFRNMDKVLDKHGVSGVDMILLDLGISSDELENSGRGFTFQKDEPLLMTLGDPTKHLFTAKNIVNGWNEEDIANVIFGYGEEGFSRRIARAIVDYRAKKKIETTFELQEIVKASVPAFYRRGKTHPATKTFQALRIAVNDELNALREGLVKGYKHLNPKGRMAVISFHSLEDRIVKDFYKQQAKKGANILTKRPITPDAQELAENPRSRSAKLRVIEKL